ncbi:MAG: zinc ribbon domain-containing protein [Gammaproteobacteria bacterium]|nr:zinc ribbon domain-containing protein [Gammaproteobacteria bacterium]
MPIYEYQCQTCDHELEKLQKLSDAALSVCPECGEAALKKKISAAGFRLKGSGWYETDFKSGSKKNIAGEAAAGSGSTPSAGGGESSAPAAPATKPAATSGGSATTSATGA